ncbi:MAG: biotin/lipoyl-containing protein [Alistipes sp.]
MKEYSFKINGNDYNVIIGRVKDNEAEVVVNGATYSVEVVDDEPAKPSAKQSVAAPQPIAAAKPVAMGEMPVKSPLPGVILNIKVKEGDTVAVGQTLLILEAMKMENNIDSDRAGVVKSIKVNRGDSVLEGDVLIIMG